MRGIAGIAPGAKAANAADGDIPVMAWFKPVSQQLRDPVTVMAAPQRQCV